MSTIELAQANLAEDVSRFADRVRTADAVEAKSIYDRLGVAREWAKLQAEASDLAERLVWLEAVILRRLGELDALGLLPSARRAAARHFATLDDAALASLLNDFPARSAVSAFNLYAKACGIRHQRQRGRAASRGMSLSRREIDEDDNADPNLRDAIETRTLTVRQAAAVIIDEYARWKPTTVSQVVDNFIDEERPISECASALEVTAFRKGLSTAVREAFIAAPIEPTDRSWEIPAFITTFDEESNEWYRVPSEFATVAQARQMLRLRRGQVDSARRSLEELERVFSQRFAIDHRSPDEYLRDDVTALTRRAVAS